MSEQKYIATIVYEDGREETMPVTDRAKGWEVLGRIASRTPEPNTVCTLHIKEKNANDTPAP